MAISVELQWWKCVSVIDIRESKGAITLLGQKRQIGDLEIQRQQRKVKSGQQRKSRQSLKRKIRKGAGGEGGSIGNGKRTIRTTEILKKGIKGGMEIGWGR